MPVFPPAAVSFPVTEISVPPALIVIAPKDTTVAAVVPVPVTEIELAVIAPV